MSLSNFSRLPFVNWILFRLFPEEPVMILLCSLTWLFPEFMTQIDSGIVTSLSWAMFIQFIFGHSAVALTLARYMPEKKSTRNVLMAIAGLFYLAFIAGFAMETRSYLLIPVFLVSLGRGFLGADQAPGNESKMEIMKKEAFYSFFAIMILIATGGPVHLFLDVPELGFKNFGWAESTQELWGEPHKNLLWGVLYFSLTWLLRKFWQKKVVGNPEWFLKNMDG